jgi:hypothetical protein
VFLIAGQKGQVAGQRYRGDTEVVRADTSSLSPELLVLCVARVIVLYNRQLIQQPNGADEKSISSDSRWAAERPGKVAEATTKRFLDRH